MFSRLINGIAGGIGAIIVAQFPEFYQQYLQQISGRLEGSREALAGFRDKASELGLTLQQYITRLEQNTDALVSGTAQPIKAIETNINVYERALSALDAAPFWQQPFVFAQWFRQEIFDVTYANYVMAVPISVSGFVYAGVGLLIGLFFVSIVVAIIRGFRRFSRKMESRAMLKSPHSL